MSSLFLGLAVCECGRNETFNLPALSFGEILDDKDGDKELLEPLYSKVNIAIISIQSNKFLQMTLLSFEDVNDECWFRIRANAGW